MQAETQRVEMFGPEGGRSSRIVLRGSVDVAVSSHLLDIARQAAVAGRDVIVDGSEIERLDLSTVQILVSLTHALPAGALRIGAMSQAGRRSLDLAGVASLFPVEPDALAEEAPVPTGAGEPDAPALEIVEMETGEYDESAWGILVAEAMPSDPPEALAAPSPAAESEDEPEERASQAGEPAPEELAGALVPLATSSTGDGSGTSRAQARGEWGGAPWEQTSSARAKPPRSGAEVRQDFWRAGLGGSDETQGKQG